MSVDIDLKWCKDVNIFEKHRILIHFPVAHISDKIQNQAILSKLYMFRLTNLCLTWWIVYVFFCSFRYNLFCFFIDTGVSTSDDSYTHTNGPADVLACLNVLYSNSQEFVNRLSCIFTMRCIHRFYCINRSD